MARTAGRMPQPERRARSPRRPAGIHIGLGVVAVVLAVMVSALMPPSAGGWRLVPVAVVLAAIGAYTVDAAAVAVVTVLACLLVVGFLVNQYGVLTWDGMSDAYRVVGISASAGAGVAFGAVRHWLRQRRRFTLPGEWVAGLPASPRGLTLLQEEEIRDA